jgi:hypothetical protein
MKRFIFPLFLLFTFSATAQIGYEDFYTEKEIQANLQRVKTIEDQIYTTGRLALYWIKYFSHSSLPNQQDKEQVWVYL